jgi:hypothetical protein
VNVAPHIADYGWLIADFVNRVPGAAHAATVSADGLVIAADPQLSKAQADTLAAITSGLVSLAQGAARSFGTEPVLQQTVEMSGGHLFIMTIGDGSSLAVLARPGCDLAQVAFEMTVLVNRVGDALTPEVRGAFGG